MRRPGPCKTRRVAWVCRSRLAVRRARPGARVAGVALSEPRGTEGAVTLPYTGKETLRSAQSYGSITRSVRGPLGASSEHCLCFVEGAQK